jgi:hypothetical protein
MPARQRFALSDGYWLIAYYLRAGGADSLAQT